MLILALRYILHSHSTLLPYIMPPILILAPKHVLHSHITPLPSIMSLGPTLALKHILHSHLPVSEPRNMLCIAT